MNAVKTIVIAVLIFAVAIGGTLFILKHSERVAIAPPAPPTALAATSAQVPAPALEPAQASAMPAPAASDGRNLAGTVNLVDGVSHVVAPDHSSRIPKAGEAIYEGDTIQTEDGAELHIDMADGGFIAVRPNSMVNLTSYQANGEAGDHSVIGLVKGSLRSITGWIGHTSPNNYSIVTPSATIGIRGTDHEPAYVAEGIPGVEAGTYDTVHTGGTTITTPAGHVDVTPSHAGFTSPRREAPRILSSVPAFFAAPRRHDGVFIGKHDQIIASLAQKRTERQAVFQREQAAPGRRGLSAPALPPHSGLPARSLTPRLEPVARPSAPLHHETEANHLTGPGSRAAGVQAREGEVGTRAPLHSPTAPAAAGQRMPQVQQRAPLQHAPAASAAAPSRAAAPLPAPVARSVPVTRPVPPAVVRQPILPPRKKPLFPN